MDERERDEDSGRYTDKYPPADVLAAIEGLEGRAATSEVAESIGCSRDTAYKKLQSMEDAGELASKKAGGIRIWSIVEDSEEDEGGPSVGF